MSTQVQLRRGTTAENDEFTGAEGEITIDTTNDTIRVHDGLRRGGYPVMKGNPAIVPGTYCKITYDEKGLVVGGQQLAESDLPITSLDRRYPRKPSSFSGGTFTKVTLNEDGVATGGTSLSPSDIPTIGQEKVTGLSDALQNKADKLTITSFLRASGSITLAEGVNVVTMSGTCTLNLPVVVDTSVFHQCMVQIEKALDEYSINVNVNKYFGGVAPNTTGAGTYNLYFEYDVPTGTWVYGAIKKGE